MRRRAFLRLALAGSPLLLARCAESPAPDVFFPARPNASRSAMTTPRPERLGLGTDRDGFFYAPPQPKNAPVLLYLHGATGSGERAIPRLVGFADRTGTIVAAPDSRDRTWGVVLDDEDADVQFIDRALNKIFASCAVDARRIAIGGFSDGASAALSWGLLNGDLFCGVAAFSPGFIRLSSAPRGLPRVFISHGTDDPILPIERCGRRIARELKSAGYTVNYREFP